MSRPFDGVVREYRAESLYRQRIQDVSRANPPSPVPRPPSLHAHVEWRAGPEGKPALRRIDLMRAHAEVEQDAIGTELSNGGNGGRGGKGGFEILHAVGAETVAGGRDGVGIAVETQDRGANLAQDRRVAAAAECRIDGARAAAGPRAHSRGENRDVVWNRRGARGCRSHP